MDDRSTGADLIQKDNLRIDHHGAAKLQQLLLTAGQIARIFVGDMGDLQKIDDLVGLRPNRRFLRADCGGT